MIRNSFPVKQVEFKRFRRSYDQVIWNMFWWHSL